MENRKVVITGATSGIGAATARLLARQKATVIACGRRRERLSQLQAECPPGTVVPYSFDVSDRASVERFGEQLQREHPTVDVLINNAGNAHGLAPIDEGDIGDWEAMIDTNVKGLLYVSKVLFPLLKKSSGAHIVNLGSIAGIEVYPQGNAYCASKFAVKALSDAMRIDLLAHNIKVSEIQPGLVDTEFSTVRFKGDHQRAKQVYQGMEALTAEDIAEFILFILSRPKHVNIAQTLILPTAQASMHTIKRES